MSSMGIFLLVLGIVAYVFIGLCWAAAYDQEASVLTDDHLFLIGAFWPMVLIWMIFYSILCTINKWYRWATKR